MHHASDETILDITLEYIMQQNPHIIHAPSTPVPFGVAAENYPERSLTKSSLREIDTKRVRARVRTHQTSKRIVTIITAVTWDVLSLRATVAIVGIFC